MNLTKVQVDIQAAVEKAAKAHGLDVGSLEIRGDGGMLRVTASLTAPGVAEAEWNHHRKWLGLDDVAFGATFKSGRDVYRIAGVRPRSRTYPVLGARLRDDKVFMFRADTVKVGL